jgi:hypothetical protein
MLVRFADACSDNFVLSKVVPELQSPTSVHGLQAFLMKHEEAGSSFSSLGVAAVIPPESALPAPRRSSLGKMDSWLSQLFTNFCVVLKFPHRFAAGHGGPHRHIWDSMRAVMVAYTVLAAPFRAAFEEAPAMADGPWFAVEMFATLLFTLDAAIEWLDVKWWSHSKLSTKCANAAFLCLKTMSALPLDWLSFLILRSTFDGRKVQHIWRVLRMVQLFRLACLISIVKKFDKVGHHHRLMGFMTVCPTSLAQPYDMNAAVQVCVYAFVSACRACAFLHVWVVGECCMYLRWFCMCACVCLFASIPCPCDCCVPLIVCLVWVSMDAK